MAATHVYPKECFESYFRPFPKFLADSKAAWEENVTENPVTINVLQNHNPPELYLTHCIIAVLHGFCPNALADVLFVDRKLSCTHLFRPVVCAYVSFRSFR